MVLHVIIYRCHVPDRVLHEIIIRCQCPRHGLTRNHNTMPMSQTWSYM
ncbi:Ancient ubiquitous 1 [Gossypium arboreum]|uniref:Ancient ubiquitous 1 n=1 Tax=Gossypium arboreum TaxID=29729 RepID=A0A0B0PC13_GOSAR|nr:Ancient ubiquitous 1 [Gossypium arboreum]